MHSINKCELFINDLYYYICETNSLSVTTYIEQKISKEVERESKHLATREDLEKGFKDQTRWILGVFITLSLMILGLYATILLK